MCTRGESRQLSNSHLSRFPGVSFFFEHRSALVRDKKVMHVVRVLILLCQNPFQQHTRGWVLVAKIPDHLAIGLDRNPLRYQIFLNHFDQIVALDVLRGGTRRDTFWVEIRLTAQLIDPLSEKVEMLLLIFRVLSKLFFHCLTCQTLRTNGVEFIAE